MRGGDRIEPNPDHPRSIQSQDHLTSKDCDLFILAEAWNLPIQKCITTHASKKSHIPLLCSFLNKIGLSHRIYLEIAMERFGQRRNDTTEQRWLRNFLSFMLWSIKLHELI
jgi:hypothetical protein